jgi:uncharacterized protein (TIGR02001 family)
MGLGISKGTKNSFAALALCGLAVPALAGGSVKDGVVEEPKRDLQLSANFSVTSDYVFRGFSQSREKPAYQGGIDATYKWLYAGIWGSHIDFGPVDAPAEVDFYAGIKPVLGPITSTTPIPALSIPAPSSTMSRSRSERAAALGRMQPLA